MDLPLFKQKCPICEEMTLDTKDVNQATWVALGEAVCSRICHENAYDLLRVIRPKELAPHE